MPYQRKIADRIREALVNVRHVEEKKMFRDLCFMVNGKMCICVGGEEMTCLPAGRCGVSNPEDQKTTLERRGCRAMVRKEKVINRFVFVSAEGMKTKKDFDCWITISWHLLKKLKHQNEHNQIQSC